MVSLNVFAQEPAEVIKMTPGYVDKASETGFAEGKEIYEITKEKTIEEQLTALLLRYSETSSEEAIVTIVLITFFALSAILLAERKRKSLKFML